MNIPRGSFHSLLLLGILASGSPCSAANGTTGSGSGSSTTTHSTSGGLGARHNATPRESDSSSTSDYGYGTGSTGSTYGTSTASSITDRIPRGSRAFAFPSDEGSAVGNWTLPGTKVDVIFTEPGKAGHGTRTTTLFQNINVIAGGGLGSKAIILQLLPEQVQQLSTALDTGHVRLSLRGINEPASASIAPDNSDLEFRVAGAR